MEILSDQEMLRYNRQIILKQFDFEGQEALKQSSVLVLGAGGLGCASSQYLATAGVGKLTLVDDDVVELSNLQRQVLHHDSDIGKKKVDSAADALKELNPHLNVATVDKMEGQISVFTYQDAEQPCYECLSALFGDGALSCVEAGVMAPVVGIVGAVQAMEAIKVIANYGTPKQGKILMLDAMTMSWREMKLMKMPTCSVCN
ncbi:ThiF family adenylyltransferase [Vibrio sinaloensis]|uniref:ThiF family adenylyltransferase n=1 Tax=Photobacterium sp. (strain ATCC 43367) TaxID=379097 RepID=UPI002F416CC4